MDPHPSAPLDPSHPQKGKHHLAVYTADDRESGEFPTDPTASAPFNAHDRYDAVKGATPTLAALVIMWAERDQKYAVSPKYITDEQIEAARLFRRREANDLPEGERERGFAIVDAWYPPDHGQDSGVNHRRGLAGWLE